MTVIPTIVGLLLATFLFDYVSNNFGQRVSSFFSGWFLFAANFTCGSYWYCVGLDPTA